MVICMTVAFNVCATERRLLLGAMMSQHHSVCGLVLWRMLRSEPFPQE